MRLYIVVILVISVTTSISANTITPGNHDPLYTNVVTTTETGESALWVDHDALDLNGSIKLEASNASQITGDRPIRLQTGGRAVFDGNNPLVITGYLSLNETNIGNVNRVSGQAISLNGSTKGIDVEAANTVDFTAGGQPTFSLQNGIVSFDQGTGVGAFTTSVEENDVTVPVAAAVEPKTMQEIKEGFQDLGYNPLTAPGGNTISHRVEITNGSETVIDDSFQRDDQDLSYSGSAPAEATETHTLSIERGFQVQLLDNYELDDTVSDDQSLQIFEAAPIGNPEEEYVEVWIDGDDAEGPLGNPHSFIAFEDRDIEYNAGDHILFLSGEPTTVGVDASSCSLGEGLDDSVSCEQLDTFLGGEGLSVASDGTIASDAGTGLSSTGGGHEISFAGSGCSTGSLVTGLSASGVNCGTT